MGHSASSEERVVVVSNRAPYVLSSEGGKLELTRAVSGLVSAVEPLLNERGGTWIAWGGRSALCGSQFVLRVPPEKPVYRLVELPLSEDERRDYYYGFSNSCLWPLCHSFTGNAVFDAAQWDAYREVNEKFARAALEFSRAQDLIWVHDYHFALLPSVIREARPQGRIALFWHIPFPPYDIFSLNPWYKEIIAGMLGANIVAFHTRSYAENFIDCARRALGAGASSEYSVIYWKGRTVSVRAVPVGIDWPAWQELAGSPQIRAKASSIRRALGAEFVLLGIDRLDYTKGVLERLQAFELFLKRHPQYRGRVTLVQVGVETRPDSPFYQKLKLRVEEAVGRINGGHDRIGFPVPVRYLRKSLSKEDVAALYLAADVLLVTPLRDGLNLVAKEYVASRQDNTGVLILSRFAGAAEELKKAIQINPYDVPALAEAIKKALEMPREEAVLRMSSLRRVVRQRDLRWWWHNALAHVFLPQVAEGQPEEHAVNE